LNIVSSIITIFCNNLKVVQQCNKEINKSSIGADKRISSIEEIKRLIDKLTIKVSIEYASIKIKVPITFECNPRLFLIK